jgi:hypothetical protein
MAKKYMFTALVNAKEGADEEFNDWHTKEHLPQLIEIAGFTRATRMKLVPGTNGDGTVYQYLVLLEIETDDPMAALAKMGAAVNSGEIKISESLGALFWSSLYEKIPGASL